MALQGALDTFDLEDVLRLLASTEKSGLLTLTGDRGQGSVWVVEGQVEQVSVDVDTTIVEHEADAIFHLLRFESGEYVFEDGETSESPLDEPQSIESVLSDARARLHEWSETVATVPGLETWLTLAATIEDDVVLEPTAWQRLAMVGSGCSIREMGGQLGEAELSTMRAVKGLVERGLVDVGEAPAPPADLPVVEAADPIEYVVPVADDEQVAVASEPLSSDTSGEVPESWQTAAPASAWDDAEAAAPIEEWPEVPAEPAPVQEWDPAASADGAWAPTEESPAVAVTAHEWDTAVGEPAAEPVAGEYGAEHWPVAAEPVAGEQWPAAEPVAAEPVAGEQWPAAEPVAAEQWPTAEPVAAEPVAAEQWPTADPVAAEPVAGEQWSAAEQWTPPPPADAGYPPPPPPEGFGVAADAVAGVDTSIDSLYDTSDDATWAEGDTGAIQYGDGAFDQAAEALGWGDNVDNSPEGFWGEPGEAREPQPVSVGADDASEMARQLAGLSPAAARAVAQAARATTPEEREAALAQAEAEDSSVDRSMLLRFLGSFDG